MRVNPLHESTCHNRIGMYRQGQCTDGPHPCVFLGECDQHYIPESGNWDYPDPLEIKILLKKVKSNVKKGLSQINNHKGQYGEQPSRQKTHRRDYLVKKGSARKIPIKTNLSQAIKKAGL